MTGRKKPGRAFWTAVTLAVVLVGSVTFYR